LGCGRVEKPVNRRLFHELIDVVVIWLDVKEILLAQ